MVVGGGCCGAGRVDGVGVICVAVTRRASVVRRAGVAGSFKISTVIGSSVRIDERDGGVGSVRLVFKADFGG